MRIPYRYWLVAALLIVLPAACDNGNNFTQESGFAEILASLSDKPPAETDRLLLLLTNLNFTLRLTPMVLWIFTPTISPMASYPTGADG